MASKPSIFALRYFLPYCTNKAKLGPVLLYRNQNLFYGSQRTLKTLSLVPVLSKKNLFPHQDLLQIKCLPWLCDVYSGQTRNGCGQLLNHGLRKYSTVYEGFTDYEAERKNFKLDVPEYYNFSRDVMDKWANAEKTGERESDIPAFWWVDKDGTEVKWTYQDVARMSNRVANILTDACSLKPGDRAIVILPKIPQWWLLNVAMIRAGVVLSPGTTMLRKKDIVHRLHASKAACIITDSTTADMVDQVADESPYLTSKVLVNTKSDRDGWLNFEDLFEKASEKFDCVNTKANDPMTLFFTSGTTGAPKMTEHTHVSYPIGHVLTARYYLLLTPTSVMWNMSDTGWAKSAYSNIFSPWIAGSCVFIYNYSQFDPIEVLKVLSTYPVTHFCSPPTAFRSLLQCDLKQYRFPHLRHSLCAGEPVNPEVIDEWKAGTGLMIYEGYGQTETTLLCGSFTCIDYRVGSMGKATPGVDLQIVDEKGAILPRGEEGEIGVRYKPHRPVGLFSQYVDDPEKTKSRFKGDFYLTGDKAYMDEDDYIFFVGRADDVIISAGYRIGPFEVESALLEHPSVLESAVVSSPHKERGEVVKAFVILTPEYVKEDKTKLIKELQDHVKQTTAPYKYPRKVYEGRSQKIAWKGPLPGPISNAIFKLRPSLAMIEFVKELPKTVSGKIRRIELRNREWGK